MHKLNKIMRKLDASIDEARQRIKGIEDRKIIEEVFDRATLMSLYHLANIGVLDLLFGVIKTGKEANIFLGRRKGKNLAVKIHRVATTDYRRRLRYIDGDYRFRGVKRSMRGIVYAWVEKEFKNLQRGAECGVRVPKPVAFENNIVVMEFIGSRNVSAPMLKNAEMKKPKAVFEKIIENVKILYCKANLVHGDLSEYNVLLHRDEPVLIDLSQAVVKEHPLAQELLRRDVRNICRYFRKFIGEIDEAATLERIMTCK